MGPPRSPPAGLMLTSWKEGPHIIHSGQWVLLISSLTSGTTTMARGEKGKVLDLPEVTGGATFPRKEVGRRGQEEGRKGNCIEAQVRKSMGQLLTGQEDQQWSLPGSGMPPRPCTLSLRNHQWTPLQGSQSAARLPTQRLRTGSEGWQPGNVKAAQRQVSLRRAVHSLAGGHPWARCTLGEQHGPGEEAGAQVWGGAGGERTRDM